MTTARALLIALFLVSIQAFSQFSFGVKAGTNLSTFRGSYFTDSEEPTISAGANAGLMASYGFGKLIGLRIDALYNLQRMKLEPYSLNVSNASHKRTNLFLNGAQGNLMLELKPASGSEGDGFHTSFLIGGFYRYNYYSLELFERTYSFSGSLQPADEMGYTRIDNYLNTSNFGPIGGVNLSFGKENPWSIEVIYQHGLEPINKPDISDFYVLKNTFNVWGKDLYISSVSLNLNYKF